jgi:hypothetical protein
MGLVQVFDKNYKRPSNDPMRATRPDHIVTDQIILIIFGEEYKL